jgi:signal transduction histidine kinase
VASYVALGVALTLAALAAGRYARLRVDALHERHTAVLRTVEEVAALAGSAAEEGFSFVLAGDPEERELATGRLAQAEAVVHQLENTGTLSVTESAALDRVRLALARRRQAAAGMFDSFSRHHAVARADYEAYDQAIDATVDAIALLRQDVLDEGAREQLSAQRTSDLLTLAAGLAALAGAVVGGGIVSSRITKPLLELRNAAVAFGSGQGDIRVPDKSGDEIGELGAAFETMAVAIQQHVAQLANAQKLEALGLVAGSVAHDFNNVLGAVLACSEVALDAVGEQHPVAVDLRDIADAARRGALLSQQLLAFSRPQLSLPRLVPINEAVESVVPMLKRLSGVDLALHVNLDPSALVVRVDTSQLDQVLVNLVVNARDASPPGGTIEVQTSRRELAAPLALATGWLEAGSYALLTVRDAGTGIPKEVQGRLFEPFFTTKEAGKGTGLGLATVARIVRQAGGAVALESARGRGTTFRVYLPIARPISEPEPGRSRRTSASSSSQPPPAARSDANVNDHDPADLRDRRRRPIPRATVGPGGVDRGCRLRARQPGLR